MELEKNIAFSIQDYHCEVRTIYGADVNQSYIDGLKNQREYIKNIPENVNLISQKQYVSTILSSKDDLLLGLYLDGELIATSGVQQSLSEVFLEDTDVPFSRVATMGVFIFDQKYRGLGLGKVLVWATTYLFHDCTNTRIYGAGMEIDNLPSLKSFVSCGFKQISRTGTYYKA
jgi:hypothetical protein